MYTSMFLLEDWQDSPQPCGCKIERQDDNPKEAIASLCLIHTFAPWMYDCLRQIVATPLRGDEALSAATEVLGRMESVRMTTQIMQERDRRRQQRGARKKQKKAAAGPGQLEGAEILECKAFHREGWTFEEKVDGYRMVAYKADRSVKLVSRQGLDHTARFPGVVAAIRALEVPTLILDGEIAVFDQKLISRFEWLRRRAPAEVATPPLFMAFDCLFAWGKDLRDRPLYVRRNVIEDTLDDQDLVLPVRRLPTMGSRRGSRCSSTGTRGWWPRTRSRPTAGPDAGLAQGEAAGLSGRGARLVQTPVRVQATKVRLDRIARVG